jgi:hypothetical protein
MSARVGGIIGLPCGRDPTQAGAVSHRALVHQACDQSDGNPTMTGQPAHRTGLWPADGTGNQPQPVKQGAEQWDPEETDQIVPSRDGTS